MTKFIVHWTTSEFVFPYEYRQHPKRCHTTGEIPMMAPNEEAARTRMLKVLEHSSDRNTRMIRVDWVKEAV
jgi:hypothetical protein